MLPNLTFHLLILFIQAVSIYWLPTDKVYTGAHGWNGSLYWPQKTKNKGTVTLETDQIARRTFCFPTATYLFKAMRPPDSRPLATWLQDSATGLKLTITSENFSLLGYEKDPVRKGGHRFFSRGSHPLIFPQINSLFLPDCPAYSLCQHSPHTYYSRHST